VWSSVVGWGSAPARNVPLWIPDCMLYLSILPLDVATIPKCPQWLTATAVTGAGTVPSSSCFGGSSSSFSDNLYPRSWLDECSCTNLHCTRCKHHAQVRSLSNPFFCCLVLSASPTQQAWHVLHIRRMRRSNKQLKSKPVPRQLPGEGARLPRVSCEHIGPVFFPCGRCSHVNNNWKFQLLLRNLKLSGPAFGICLHTAARAAQVNGIPATGGLGHLGSEVQCW
jgi:hypothetical protein